MLCFPGYGDVTLKEPSVIRQKVLDGSPGGSGPKTLNLKQTRETDKGAEPDRKRQKTCETGESVLRRFINGNEGRHDPSDL